MDCTPVGRQDTQSTNRPSAPPIPSHGAAHANDAADCGRLPQSVTGPSGQAGFSPVAASAHSHFHRHLGFGRAAATATGPMNLHVLQRMLPHSSQVTVMAADGGLHVAIRDATLTQADIKRMISKMRALLDLHDQNFFAVTLNGQSIWTLPSSQPQRAPDDDMHDERKVDQLY